MSRNWSVDPEGHYDKHGNFLDKPNAIGTWTRRRVDPFTMAVDDVDIEDIAHSLSRICRYNGHCAGHLSVARHSLWVMDKVMESPQGVNDLGMQLTALMHDAAEAYLGDVPRPLKKSGEYWFYRETEEKVEQVIAIAFGLKYPRPDLVTKADSWVLTHEELPRLRWTWYGSAERDKAEFLHRFDTLMALRAKEQARETVQDH